MPGTRGLRSSLRRPPRPRGFRRQRRSTYPPRRRRQARTTSTPCNTSSEKLTVATWKIATRRRDPTTSTLGSRRRQTSPTRDTWYHPMVPSVLGSSAVLLQTSVPCQWDTQVTLTPTTLITTSLVPLLVMAQATRWVETWRWHRKLHGTHVLPRPTHPHATLKCLGDLVRTNAMPEAQRQVLGKQLEHPRNG